MSDTRKTAREIAEALLSEYAPGQPRDRKGRFGATGGGGGAGGGEAPGQMNAGLVVKSVPKPVSARVMSPPTTTQGTTSATPGTTRPVDFRALPEKMVTPHPTSGKTDLEVMQRTPEAHTLTSRVGADGRITADGSILHGELAHRQILTPAEVKKVGVAREDGKPTLVMLGGGGGAGKSTLLGKIDADPAFKRELSDLGIVVPAAKLNLKENGTTERLKDSPGVHRTAGVINADHAKVGLWDEVPATRKPLETVGSDGKITVHTAASRVHEESSVISQRALEIGVQQGGDIILDGTGDGSVAKRQAQFTGAATSHEVVGIYVTTKIGVDAESGVRGDVARRGTKPITLTDGATVTRAIPDGLIVSAHRDSNTSFLQGISNPGTMFHKAVVYERTPVLTSSGAHAKDAGGRLEYKFTLAGHFDGTRFTPLIPGIRERMAARAGTDTFGKKIEGMRPDLGLDEAVKKLLSILPYHELLALWVEVLSGLTIDDSEVLDRYPEAEDEWFAIEAEIAATPADLVIDIPAEISERSIRLQSIYADQPIGEPVAEAAYALGAHNNALYDIYEKIVMQHGKWSQDGVDGARYVNESPFMREGIMCGNCMFYEADGKCELVEGIIRPEGGCKLNIKDPMQESTPARARALRALARAKVRNRLKIKAGKNPVVDGKEISVSTLAKKYEY
ncbi:hypothetical protein UFOVP1336_29 [uncultured Caudovirales phage]|uniref:Zeta toxin domain containing protein n=1 Tax=uncultured Caudovirales phage TaxID=2100421 RepID=A0A6J5RY80_9CAUD|nr:hypothetical protein UFOVP1336_29 [uncultured Caudovirales phage]